jgi:signal recognition particle subunit SRP72
MASVEVTKGCEYLATRVKKDPTDIRALALLVHGYAKINVKQANQYHTHLHAMVPGLLDLKTTDTDTLESLTSMTRWKLKGAAQTTTKNQSHRRRKRKNRPPKNCDPNKKPNPERWLPKRLRSDYLKQLKRKHRGDLSAVRRGPQGIGVQGAAVDVSESLSSSPVKPAATTSKKSVAPKKKKKKGTKW